MIEQAAHDRHLFQGMAFNERKELGVIMVDLRFPEYVLNYFLSLLYDEGKRIKLLNLVTGPSIPAPHTMSLRAIKPILMN